MPERPPQAAPPSTLVGVFAAAVLLGVAERVPALSAGGLALLLGWYPWLLHVACGAPPYLRPASSPHLTGAARPASGAVLPRLVVAGLGLALGYHAAAEVLPGRIGPWPPAAAAFALAAMAAGVCLRAWRSMPGHGAIVLLLPLGGVVGFGLSIAEPPSDAPSALGGLMAAAMTAATTLAPGVPFERALVLSGAHASVVDLLTRGAHGGLALMLLVVVAALALGAHALLRALLRYPGVVETVLLGVFSGGLVRAWPWQATTSYTLTLDGAQLAANARPLAPLAYAQQTGGDPQLLAAALAALAGVGAVWLVQQAWRRRVQARSSGPGQ